MQTLSRRGRVSDGGQMTFPFLKVTKFPNDVLFFHRISLQLISNLCYQAIEPVYLIKWPVSVYGTILWQHHMKVFEKI